MTTAVVFGYSEVGERCLRVLLRHGVQVQLVFSHEDDPSEVRWYRSVAEIARSNHIGVVTPADPNTGEWISAVAQLRPDFIFSFYYRHMLCNELLGLASRGALNMHGSLLPKYRGRAPVNWAILHGETETGASLHYMSSAPDAGPLVGQERVPIRIEDTALDVSLQVAAAAERLLDRLLPDLIAGRAPAIPLDLSQGSYFGRRRPEDGQISWHWPALRIHNLIRAVAPPFPGAFGVSAGRTFRLLGSRYLREPARFPQLAPCLYANDLALYLDCVDGSRLTLPTVQLDGKPLTPNCFAASCGTNVLSLGTLEAVSCDVS
ncbi:formyltransferase [Steroidobacter cummioxidans]|uniref:formyltransferase n=1 Tax=Steroidobacter cummioxidans TaxID=1803913 RepID=UPI000E31099C|nr:formyltransferase [Steroidobacter cummioxidans]